MRKVLLSLTATALLSMPTMALADSSDIKVQVNNQTLQFNQPPVIIDGSTLVPLRGIFEALGATVNWDQASQTVTATKGDTTIKLTIGQSTATRNNSQVQLSVPGRIINGSTMVPTRFIAESFGEKVGWNGNTRTVFIGEQGDSSQAPETSNSSVPATDSPTPALTQATFFNSSDNGKALYAVNTTFNTKLEQAMLAQVNAYRAYYKMPALSLLPTKDNFSHQDIAWTVDPANANAVPHAYFMANASNISFNPSWYLSGEIATIVGDSYPLEAENVLSSNTDTKDEVNYVTPYTVEDISLLNKAYNNSTTLEQLAYSLVYMYGDDGQPAGYAGTNAVTQGSAHKQNLLNPNHKYVTFGVGIDSKGNIQQVIDFYDSLGSTGSISDSASTPTNTTTSTTSTQTSSTMSYNDFIAYTGKLLANTLISENAKSNNGTATSSLAADSSPLWNEAQQNTAADIPLNECSWTVKINGQGLLTWWGQDSAWVNNYTQATAQEIVDYFITTRLTAGSGYLHDDTIWKKSLPKGIAVGISINQTTGRTFFNILSEGSWSGTNEFYN